MGLRRLLGAAVDKMDALGDNMHEADVAKLSPAERERYEAWEARSAAARAGVPQEELPDPRLAGAVLQGEAALVPSGSVKRSTRREAIEDPVAWAAQRDAEREARDRAREPYLAPRRHPIRVTRVATRGKSQIREISDFLASSGLAGRPDLVYGAARVPDFISPGKMGSEKNRVVEWDIVHAAPDGLSPAPPPAAVFLDAADRLVARAVGERRPLDEDVALDLLVRAGIGPEATLAVARDVVIEKQGGGEDDLARIPAIVRGVHVLVAGSHAADLRTAADAPRPWPVAGMPPDGMRVDVLQWEEIAKAVHPVRQHRPPMPSPFPHLPVTAVELLRTYLDVVGIDPADAFAAQVTHDAPLDLIDRTSSGGFVRRTGGGPDLPCADGKSRPRIAGGQHVVVAYRDRADYVEGRTRFADYAATVMEAHLERNLGLREPVPPPPSRLERTLERAASVYELFTLELGDDVDEPRPRYCWPPAGR